MAAGAATCAFRSAFDAFCCGVAKSERFSDALGEFFALLEESVNYPAKTG